MQGAMRVTVRSNLYEEYGAVAEAGLGKSKVERSARHAAHARAAGPPAHHLQQALGTIAAVRLEQHTSEGNRRM